MVRNPSKCGSGAGLRRGGRAAVDARQAVERSGDVEIAGDERLHLRQQTGLFRAEHLGVQFLAVEDVMLDPLREQGFDAFAHGAALS